MSASLVLFTRITVISPVSEIFLAQSGLDTTAARHPLSLTAGRKSCPSFLSPITAKNSVPDFTCLESIATLVISFDPASDISFAPCMDSRIYLIPVFFIKLVLNYSL